MSDVGTFSKQRLKRKAFKIEDTVQEQVKELKKWYNRKLQEIIDESEVINEQDLVNEEDWAYPITNEEFGILHRFENSDRFSMVQKHTEDGVDTWYKVTTFGFFTETNKENSDKRYIIGDRVRCQCTFMERNWFQDPYTSWYIVEEKKIVQGYLKVLAAKEFEKDDTDEYRDHYKNFLYIKNLSTLKPVKFQQHLKALNFAPTAYNVDTSNCWFGCK